MDLIVLSLAKKYANKKFSEVVKFGGFEIVEALPTEDISTSTVYLLHSTSPTEGNIYEEYIYTTEGKWESLGTTVDLEGYVTIEALNEALKTVSWNELQDKPFGEEIPGPGELLLDFGEQTFDNGSAWMFPKVDNGFNGEAAGEYYVSFGSQHILCNYEWLGTAEDGEQRGGYFTAEDGTRIGRADQMGDYPSGGYSFYGETGLTCQIFVSKTGGIQVTKINEDYIPDSIARVEIVKKDIEAAAETTQAAATEAATAAANEYTNKRISALPAHSWNTLTNKPFYEIETTSYSRENVTGSSFTVSNGWKTQPSTGSQYNVTFGDTTYLCTVPEPNNSGNNFKWEIKDEFGITRIDHEYDYWNNRYTTTFYSNIVSGQSYNIRIWTYTIKKMDAKFISGMSWNDLEDRPFGEMLGRAAICLPETTFNLVAGPYGSEGSAIVENALIPTKGKTYDILLGDYYYQRECKADGYLSIPHPEDPSYDGTSVNSTSFTFTAQEDSSAYEVSVVSRKVDGATKITIYEIGIIEVPLDNKFLSETIARIEDVEALEEYHDITLQALEEEINDRFDDLPNDEAFIQAILAALPAAEEIEI